MTTERELVARIEAADCEEFAEIVSSAGREEREALKVYFGEAGFERLYNLAGKKAGARGGARAKKGNVVVLHGIMGGELTHYAADGGATPIWLNLWSLVRGRFTRLDLDPSGRSARQVQSTGILKKYYGELMLSLWRRWNVRAFWYDWRLDMREAADLLYTRISEWYGNEPVHLVGHSMGGLVARAFIKRHRRRWDEAGRGLDDGSGGRLVMLGTPNHGSFAIPQLLTGVNANLRRLALVDVPNDRSDLLETIRTFVGTYQMLPSLAVMPAMEPLYDPASYRLVPVPAQRLEAARQFHQWLRDVVDGDRMIYVAGYNHATAVGVRRWDALDTSEGYETTLAGDGTVPHKLGLLKGVKTYYIQEEHGGLPQNETVMDGLGELLATGKTGVLLSRLPAGVRGAKAGLRAAGSANVRMREQETELRRISAGIRARAARADDSGGHDLLSAGERKLERLLMGGLLGPSSSKEETRAVPGANTKPPEKKSASRSLLDTLPKTSLQVGLLRGGIETNDWTLAGQPPVDAVAVGHYAGVLPVAAELALDEAISKPAAGDADDPHRLLLAALTERNIIRGELGEPFLLADPRAPEQRTVVVMGMGNPNRCGEPELIVLVRELVWTLIRLGKRHLATVLIGSGEGNIPIPVAMDCWLRGVNEALESDGMEKDSHWSLTFVEFNPRRLLDMDEALGRLAAGEHSFTWPYLKLVAHRLSDKQRKATEKAAARWVVSKERSSNETAVPFPDRLTVEYADEVYRFGLFSRSAAIPIRENPVNPRLVRSACEDLIEISTSPNPAGKMEARQRDSARFLRELIVPRDLAPRLLGREPLVVSCDSTSARIPWEMVAEPSRLASSAAESSDDVGFLGINRGLTRQLQTRFARPAESARTGKRVLRVLIVANPAQDDPLEGAEEEGWRVYQAIDSLRDRLGGAGSVQLDDPVVLIGPGDATMLRVMKELTLNRYDILHFAGHCLYDNDHPAKSGWIFTGGERLCANELKRIDRAPRFIFSNACESGVTPDRAAKRNAKLAPSFAEAFFSRGVQNFICTGWPVNDLAATKFAETFYREFFGLNGETKLEPVPIWRALATARKALAGEEYGLGTWGAYQHYGDPYFSFFPPPGSRR